MPSVVKMVFHWQYRLSCTETKTNRCVMTRESLKQIWSLAQHYYHYYYYYYHHSFFLSYSTCSWLVLRGILTRWRWICRIRAATNHDGFCTENRQ